jgi:hypothetical protein
MLQVIEQTQPDIYPALKKYKFKLEDASTLPENLLAKIFADADNDELGRALASCTDEVAEVLLDAVSPARRELLKHQVASCKSAPKEELKDYLEQESITREKIEYSYFTFTHSDVMGSGRYFYASDPIKEEVDLRSE